MDAEDNESIIVYTGETDVQVNAGAATNVSLTLLPTGAGEGSIYIHVIWGLQTNWVDYTENPFLTSADNPSYPNALAMSKVMLDNGLYKMWYVCNYNSARCNVWYAESRDGIHWQNEFDHPVFDSDTAGTWDDYTVQCGAIIKKDNQYLMYYNGWQSEYGPWQIGLATSEDGIHWTRRSGPVIKADNNNYRIGVISVLQVNGEYYMYCSSNPVNNNYETSIKLAVSQDGINWEMYGGNPVLTATLGWEGDGILYPAVIYDNNRFVMIYGSTDRTKFGIAFSSDGIHWEKNSDPTFTIENTVNGLSQINYPFLIKTDGGYRLYYTATNSAGNINLCLAVTRIL